MPHTYTELPDIESVRCFVAGATHLNFRIAATTVRLSPGAFGQRIARLEAQLGTALFERTTRRVSLTPAGHRLQPLARSLLTEAGRFRSALREPSVPIPFELTLGTRFELGTSWITPALDSLSRNRPERTLHLSFGDNDSLIRRLTRGAIDCAVTSSRVVPSGMTYEALHREEYAFVATPAVARTLRCPADASACTLLDIGSELPLFRYFLDAQGSGDVWTFARVERLGTIAAIKQRLLGGFGVAVLPRYFSSAELADGALIALLPAVALKTDAFRLIWRAGHPQTVDLRALAGELKEIPLR